MSDSIKFWALFGAITVAILVVGWKQPLSYRFMSKKEIESLSAPTPAPPPKGSWMWDSSKRSTQLDRGSYNRRSVKSDSGLWTSYQ